MVLEQKILNVIAPLFDGRTVRFESHGTPIVAQLHAASKLLQMRALLYQVGEFFPKKVKDAVARAYYELALDFPGSIAYCPQSQAVYLDAHCECLDLSELKHAIEDFLLAADEWRHRLDDLDRQDRVRVPVK